jgi:hypothetical protein
MTTIDLDDIYETTIDGLLDNSRVNDVVIGAGWQALEAIETYNPALDIDALPESDWEHLERRVFLFLRENEFAKAEDI